MRSQPSFAAATALVAAALMVGGCASPPSAPSRPETQSSASTSSSQGAASSHAAPNAAEAQTVSASTGSAAAASGDSSAKVASSNIGSRGQGAAGSALPGAAQTPEERRTAIERKLDDSLGTFDAQLRKEQERVAKERDARQAAAVTTTAGDDPATADPATADPQGQSDKSGSAATEGPDQEARGNAGGRRASSDRRNARAGDLKSEKSTGTGTAPNDNAGNGATARQIPDGSDDDVVARRLRKAAEQETDPELKDKLWKEYIDYKNNAGK